jgi:two-component system sensor histidine kinase VicK
MTNRDDNFQVLQEIGDLANEGMIIYDLKGQKITYSNSAASELTGLKTNDSRREIETLVHNLQSQDQSYVRQRLAAVDQGSAISDVECRLIRDGEEVRLCCNAYLVSNGETMVVGIRDITKPKEHESYLVEYGARKDVLLDSLTHYISGAMGLVRNLTEHTEKALGRYENEQLGTYFSLVSENCKVCVDIINDLMRDEHLESPTVFVKRTRTDVVRLTHQIYEQVAHFSDRHFLFETAAPSIFIHTDEVKLMQVFNNLASNAVKFTPAGNEIRFNILRTDTDVVISIADKGIGIPDHLKHLVFERQGGAGRPGLNGEKSLGLGLSICKNLVQLLGGEIWFTSNEGEGSTFFVRLPKE